MKAFKESKRVGQLESQCALQSYTTSNKQTVKHLLFLVVKKSQTYQYKVFNALSTKGSQRFNQEMDVFLKEQCISYATTGPYGQQCLSVRPPQSLM